MSNCDDLLRQLKRIEQSIEELEDYKFHVKSNLRPPRGGRLRLVRAVRIFLLLRHIDRQIQQLQLRRNAALNCYHYVQRREKSRLKSAHE